MSNREQPYIVFEPGDPFDPDRVNDMQRMIRRDLNNRIEEGLETISRVDDADNALKAKQADHAARATHADTADYAIKAGDAERAKVAETAKQAECAATATEANTAALATRATHADNAALAARATQAEKATEADHATSATQAANADNATLAKNALKADLATTAENATTAVLAEKASWAEGAKQADYAPEAGHALSADQATEAAHAASADRAKDAEKAIQAERTISAERATIAEKADYASRAGSAVTADSATRASLAAEAELAHNATQALNATHAVDADSAKGALHAKQADNAAEAKHAARAEYALQASSAESATVAQTAAHADAATKADQAERAAYADKAGEAESAGKLGNHTLDEIRALILEEIKAMSYRMHFKRLRLNQENVLEHGIGAFPVTDIYQLDYFQVVTGEDRDPRVTWVNFYLYHSSEDRIRYRNKSYEIEPENDVPTRVPLPEMLGRLAVMFTPTSSLSDLVGELWKQLNHYPGNDRFDDTHHTHSPWFDACCREEKTVQDLVDNGDWDDLYVQFRPRKTVNLSDPKAVHRPSQVQVTHLNFNALSLRLVAEPVYSDAFRKAAAEVASQEDWAKDLQVELPVMVVLSA